MENITISKNRLIEDLKNLGIKKGDIINMKVSLKSIGKIEGGVTTLIDAIIEIIGEDGAIMTESFIKMVPKWKLNRKNPSHFSNEKSLSYAGAFTNEVLKHPKAIIGNHPTHRYAGIGVKIKNVIESHNVNDDPYLVLEKFANLGGKNLRIGPKEKVVGVGTTHIAINKSKLRQKRPKAGLYYYQNGEIKVFENWWATGCEKAFNKIIENFKGTDAIINEGKIGNADSLLTNMSRTLEIETKLIRDNPKNILCDDPSCPKCQIAWEFNKGNSMKCILSNLKRKNIKGVLSCIYYIFNTNYLPK